MTTQTTGLAPERIDEVLDCSGVLCPLPVYQASLALGQLSPGQVLEVITTDPGALEDIPALAQLQGELLDALWPTLAPGGVLLYATCSVLPTENSETVAAFLARTPDAQEVTIAGDFGLQSPHGRQLLPQLDGHDGFYYAKLIKTAAPARG